MRAAQEYHRLTLNCLDLAEATRDPKMREQMIRLAEHCAWIADRQEGRTEHERQAA